MTVEVIGNEYMAILSHEDLKNIVSCVHYYGDFHQYRFVGEIEKGRAAIPETSDTKYEKFQDHLKLQWCFNCDIDDKLTDRIERAQDLLTQLQNLGFDIVKGEMIKND